MDFDDDDAHPCGCDRACVCSDRFSWFAVPPTPVYCDGTFAADSLQVHQIPSRGCTPLEIFHLNFRSLFQSERHEFDKSHCIGKSLRSARQVCARRTHEASRSEHDLNLAILYAVQSGFRYSASLFLPDLRCRPLGELCSGCSRQRGALIQGRFRGPQASRFWPIFQVLFYSSRLFAGACNPDLQSRPAIQTCNPDLQSRPAIQTCNPDLQSRPAMLRVIARERSLQSRLVVRH
jgi:hypothetical protein